MPEYLAPGVYVEEVSFRSKSIEGVSTSTTAFVGPTRKGPLSGTPALITSFGEFSRIYGGLANLSFRAEDDANPRGVNYMAHAVRNFFDNGGSRLYIARAFTPRTGDDASTGIAASALYAVNGDNHAQFIARAPGSGLNGTIRAIEKRSPAASRTMNAAPAGSLLYLDAVETPRPATMTGAAGPPFALQDGAILTLTLQGGVTHTVVFNGAPAEAMGVGVQGPVSIPPGSTLNVTLGGVQQAISLPDGSIPLTDLVDLLNETIVHGYARLEAGDKIVIGGDIRGTDAGVVVGAFPELGFNADTAAPAAGDPLLGNVGNLEKVTIDDLNRLFDEAQPPVPAAASADPVTGVLVLSTTENPGPGAVIIAAGPAAPALGLTNPCTHGFAGAGPGYYTKDDQGWVSAADASYLDAGVEPAGAWLVTMNIHVEDADGAAIIHEEVGFGGAHPRCLGHVLSENPTLGADALSSPFFVSIQGTVDAATLRNGIFGPDASDATFRLTGGHDGAEPAAASTAGSTPGSAASYEKALEALEDIEDISIVAAPGHNAESGADLTPYRAVQELLIGHAERMRYRIAVLDPPRGVDLAQIRQIRGFIDTTYAALYYPWIVIANPLARPGDQSIPREIPLPPSGFITGIYARNDVHRGVWKAPANEVIRGAIRFETEINHRQQEALNPEGINCLRFFFGRGNRVWGARTASSDPEWKYVNVRRCFIYLERSIDRSTQWAVFEPNGERLWANIRETVSAFLYNEWKRGALLGSKPEEAYFVRCDRSTMTQNDLDNGRLICEIGVAALYPAEFVIFRIGQKTADARS